MAPGARRKRHAGLKDNSGKVLHARRNYKNLIRKIGGCAVPENNNETTAHYHATGAFPAPVFH